MKIKVMVEVVAMKLFFIIHTYSAVGSLFGGCLFAASMTKCVLKMCGLVVMNFSVAIAVG